MNIEFINAIPLCKIFDKLKLKPKKGTDHKPVYRSPFQQGREHTIEAHRETNTWYDSATWRSGGPLEFIMDWLRHKELQCSVNDAVKWFRFNIGYPSLLEGITLPERNEPKIKLVYKSPIVDRALINYIEKRGIPLALARKHLCQLGLTNLKTGEDFVALGLKTDEGGWWVHSPYIDTFIGNRSISYIRGQKYSFRAVHIFKDIFDYMTAKLRVNDGKPFDDECIILNSYECLENSAAYIRGFGYECVNSWISNDPNGQQATKNYALLCSIEGNLRYSQLTI